MTESLKVLPPLLNYPLSRIVFITIKDNSQKWKIGKVNDWIRRYSNNYYIVRGVNGGVHFHLIAGIEKNKTIVPVKNIHFHIVNLQNKKIEIFPSAEDAEDVRKVKHHRRCLFVYLCLELDDEQINIITKIKLMIEKHFRSLNNKEKKVVVLDKKGKRIHNVLEYLQKNLDEPRLDDLDDPDDRKEYLDYILKTAN